MSVVILMNCRKEADEHFSDGSTFACETVFNDFPTQRDDEKFEMYLKINLRNYTPVVLFTTTLVKVHSSL